MQSLLVQYVANRQNGSQANVLALANPHWSIGYIRFKLPEETKMLSMKHRLVAAVVLVSFVSNNYGQTFTGPCLNVRPAGYTNDVKCQKKAVGSGCECWGVERVFPPISNCQNNNSNACTLFNQNDYFEYTQIGGGVNPCGPQHPTYGVCLGTDCVRDITTKFASALIWQTCQ